MNKQNTQTNLEDMSSSDWIIQFRSALIDKDVESMKYLLGKMPKYAQKKEELEELANLLEEGIAQMSILREDARFALQTLDKNRKYLDKHKSRFDLKS